MEEIKLGKDRKVTWYEKVVEIVIIGVAVCLSLVVWAVCLIGMLIFWVFRPFYQRLIFVLGNLVNTALFGNSKVLYLLGVLSKDEEGRVGYRAFLKIAKIIRTGIGSDELTMMKNILETGAIKYDYGLNLFLERVEIKII